MGCAIYLIHDSNDAFFVSFCSFFFFFQQDSMSSGKNHSSVPHISPIPVGNLDSYIAPSPSARWMQSKIDSNEKNQDLGGQNSGFFDSFKNNGNRVLESSFPSHLQQKLGSNMEILNNEIRNLAKDQEELLDRLNKLSVREDEINLTRLNIPTALDSIDPELPSSIKEEMLQELWQMFEDWKMNHEKNAEKWKNNLLYIIKNLRKDHELTLERMVEEKDMIVKENEELEKKLNNSKLDHQNWISIPRHSHQNLVQQKKFLQQQVERLEKKLQSISGHILEANPHQDRSFLHQKKLTNFRKKIPPSLKSVVLFFLAAFTFLRKSNFYPNTEM
jgi:hypothetical protein